VLTEQTLYNFLRENPHSTLFAQYADILLDQGKVEQAYMVSVQGVKAHPKFATGWLILGKAALRQDEKIFAKKCWMNALAADKMCLQAAELLLTTESLDLKIKEAYIAASALLNVDPEHLVARTTMNMIQEQHNKTAKTESAEPEVENVNHPEEDVKETSEIGDYSPEKSPENDYDLYGADTKNIADLLKTIEQMKLNRTAQSGSDGGDQHDGVSNEGKQHYETSGSIGDGSTPSDGHEPEEEAPEYFSESQLASDEAIPDRMATLTFVRILKSQGLYESAMILLNRINPTDANQEQINQERQDLSHLLESKEE